MLPPAVDTPRGAPALAPWALASACAADLAQAPAKALVAVFRKAGLRL